MEIKERNVLKNQEGFTLVELMVTVLVISVAFLGILGTNIAIQQNSEGVFERTMAIQDANQVIERMRNAANQAGADFQDSVVVAAEAAEAAVGSLPASHDQEITVTFVDEDADPLDATVNVAWDERGQRATSASIRTLITRRAS